MLLGACIGSGVVALAALTFAADDRGSESVSAGTGRAGAASGAAGDVPWPSDDDIGAPSPVVDETASTGVPTTTTPAGTTAPRHARPATTSTILASTSTTAPAITSSLPTPTSAPAPATSTRCERAVALQDVAAHIATSGMFTASNGRVHQLVSGSNGGAWNTDRTRVAFQVPPATGARSELCVLDLGSRIATGVTTVMWADGGSYAPGGSELWAIGNRVVANDDGSTSNLVAVDVATGAKAAITEHASFDVSPDGRRVAVLEPMSSADRHLRIHDLVTGDARVLSVTKRALAPYGIRWLDDRTVGFGNGDIITKDVDTGVETEIVAARTTPLLAWAYDRVQRRFAFILRSTQPAEDAGLYTVTRDAPRSVQFVRDDPSLAHFVWTHDGRLLSVHGDVRAGQSLRLDSLDTDAFTSVATSAAGFGFVVRDGFSPDRSRIEFGVHRYRFEGE